MFGDARASHFAVETGRKARLGASAETGREAREAGVPEPAGARTAGRTVATPPSVALRTQFFTACVYRCRWR